MGRFINPFTDWGFKKIFGQELTKDILITFLNSLFEGEHVITDLTFLDKEQQPEVKGMRGIIYDVFCVTDKGERIIVEMQNRDQANFIDRTIFYMSKAISNQGMRGDWDYRLAAVYGVFFMNFKSSDLKNTRLRTDIVLSDKETHCRLTDKVRMIYLQMPYFTKKEDECDTLFDCFIYTLKNMEILDRMPFLAKNAVFKKLAQIADVNSLTKEEHDKYDASIKVMRDNIVTHMAAEMKGRKEGLEKGRKEGLEEGLAKGLAKGLTKGREEGLAKGLTKGREEGLAKGREEGREEGRKEQSLQIARNMKAMGVLEDVISKATGLSEEEIMNI